MQQGNNWNLKWGSRSRNRKLSWSQVGLNFLSWVELRQRGVPGSISSQRSWKSRAGASSSGWEARLFSWNSWGMCLCFCNSHMDMVFLNMTPSIPQEEIHTWRILPHRQDWNVSDNKSRITSRISHSVKNTSKKKGYRCGTRKRKVHSWVSAHVHRRQRAGLEKKHAAWMCVLWCTQPWGWSSDGPPCKTTAAKFTKCLEFTGVSHRTPAQTNQSCSLWAHVRLSGVDHLSFSKNRGLPNVGQGGDRRGHVQQQHHLTINWFYGMWCLGL